GAHRAGRGGRGGLRRRGRRAHRRALRHRAGGGRAGRRRLQEGTAAMSLPVGRPRPVLALVAANLRRHTRDRVGLFFMVIMPFVSIVFVGMAIGGGATGSERLPVGVVADASDAVSAAVLAELRAHPDLEVVPMDSAPAVRDGVREGALAAGLIVPAGSTRLELVMTQANGSGMPARSAVDVSVGRVAAVLEATRAAVAAGATAEQAAAYEVG